MAELHAKEAPDRVRELEQWGGVFDRTPSGHMSQRAFGGHTHRRLVHIGDRTGLELIRTLQDKCVHQDVDVFMECTITHLLQGRRPRLRRVRLLARDAASSSSSARGRSCSRPAAPAAATRSPRTRGSAPATARRSRTRQAPSSSTWSSSSSTRPGWSGRRASRGLLVTEAVRGEGGAAHERRGRAVHGALRPGADGALDPRHRRARDLHRGRRGPRLAARRRLPRRLAPARRRRCAEAARACTPSSRSSPASTSREEPMEVGPTCHYIMGGVRVEAETAQEPRRRAVRGGRVRGRPVRRDAARRQLALRPARLRPARRRGGGRVRRRRLPAAAIDDAEVAAAAAELERVPRGDGDEDPYALHAELQQTMQRNVGIYRDEAGLTAAVAAIEELKRARARTCAAAGRSGASTRAGTSASTCRNMLVCAEAIARAALARARSRAARTAGSTSRRPPTSGARSSIVVSAARRRRWRSTTRRSSTRRTTLAADARRASGASGSAV